MTAAQSKIVFTRKVGKIERRTTNYLIVVTGEGEKRQDFFRLLKFLKHLKSISRIRCCSRLKTINWKGISSSTKKKKSTLEIHIRFYEKQFWEKSKIWGFRNKLISVDFCGWKPVTICQKICEKDISIFRVL